MHRIIEGKRTRLRPAFWGFDEDELRRRYRWSRDEGLQYWSGTIPGARNFEQFRSAIAERDWPSDGKRISYAILTKGDELIGMVSCYNIDQKSRAGEIGIYLGEKDFWSRGYGTDALATFMRHVFFELGLETAYLHTYESNVRAQRSYLHVGFEPTRRRRRYAPRVGFHQELMMTLTKERFAAIHGQREPAAAS